MYLERTTRQRNCRGRRCSRAGGYTVVSEVHDRSTRSSSPPQLAPLERLGQPGDILGAVAFLVGEDDEWVNGQVIRVNGGFAQSSNIE
ncbi:SDR family oxidoreductase [Paraburkholderia hospita]|uniref:SDR family oxidoreductase n=1 Tax=Paraburkholderia hospita TaxID=169430 RepID=UPI001FC93FB9|nr:SDR family oxidoreductase [Paraburkholderia hospita]